MSVSSSHSLKFDEQFFQTYPIATLDLDIAQILAKNPLLNFQDSYDDLDYLKYCILNVFPENQVALVFHDHCPVPRVDICVNQLTQENSLLLVEILLYLRLTIRNLKWFHPDLNIPQKLFHVNDELLGGRYIIQEQLGALTYKAKNTTLNSFFVLKFKSISESNEDFDASVQMLMDFRNDNSVAPTIMKWTYDDELDGSIFFVVQKYLETAKSFDNYLRQENNIRLKRIQLIEVAIVVSHVYEKMCGSNFKICKSNILIYNGHVKITGFKLLISEEFDSICHLLSLVRDVLDNLKPDAILSSSRNSEVNNDLQDQRLVSDFENCIQEFHCKIENTKFTNTIFRDLRNALEKVKVKEEEIINNFSNSLVKGTVQLFELFIDSLVKDEDLNTVWPPTEDRIFYATLLFKSAVNEDQFIRVYFGKYEKDVRYSSSNWEKDNELFAREKLLISNSCAGFPMIYYNKYDRKELELEKRIKFKFYDNSISKLIKYITVKDVKKAKSEPGIIRDKYQKAGWNLTTKEGLNDGEVSDDVDYMITIPIYNSDLTVIDEKSILAVIHIEIIQPLSPEDLDKIAEQFAILIHQKFTDIIKSLLHRTSESSPYVNHI